jgi:WD40 repeat protein
MFGGGAKDAAAGGGAPGRAVPVSVKTINKRRAEFEGLCRTQSVRVHQGVVWTLKFSPDGAYLASGGQDGRIIIWSVGMADGDVGAGGGGKGVGADRNSSADPAACSFNLLARTPYHIFEGHVADVIDLAWSKSNFLLSASVDKTVRLWHISRDDCLQVFRHNDIVTGIAFHPTHDRYFVSSCFDRRVRIWDIIPDGVVKDWCHAPDVITAVSFTPDGSEVAVGLYFGQVYFYDAEGLKYRGQILCQNSSGALRHGAKVTGLEFLKTSGANAGEGGVAGAASSSSGAASSGAVQLLVTTNDSNTRLVNVADSTVLCKYKGSRNGFMQIRSTFSEDGRYVLCGSETGKVYIWNTVLDRENLGSRLLFQMAGTNKQGIVKNSSCEFFPCMAAQSPRRDASDPVPGAGATATAAAVPAEPATPAGGAASSAAVATLFAPAAAVLQACPMNHLRPADIPAANRAALSSSVIVAASAQGTIEVFVKKFW